MCTAEDNLLQSSISIQDDYKSDSTLGSWYIVSSTQSLNMILLLGQMWFLDIQAGEYHITAERWHYLSTECCWNSSRNYHTTLKEKRVVVCHCSQFQNNTEIVKSSAKSFKKDSASGKHTSSKKLKKVNPSLSNRRSKDYLSTVYNYQHKKKWLILGLFNQRERKKKTKQEYHLIQWKQKPHKFQQTVRSTV